uniref:Uncharacterized protein n=1 Tax=Tanacetum cinerariifolium TaxID=118510 RepID=A0A6L2JDG5_TANCI|nr:hypothetical protein [Tanacetum cinerariifolium]
MSYDCEFFSSAQLVRVVDVVASPLHLVRLNKRKLLVENRGLWGIIELLLYQWTYTPYPVKANTPHRSVECQVRRIEFTEYAVLFGEQIRYLDSKTQYAVLNRRIDTSYPTSGYGVSGDQTK